MLTAAVAIRKAIPADIPEILKQRQRMHQDMGATDARALTAMAELSEGYLGRAFDDNSFHAWLALAGEHAAGGGAIIVSPWLAHPYDLECRRATILNVYVYPEFRRRRIATEMMKTMISWCKDEGFAAVYLHASEDGKPVYEFLGFVTGNEMKLNLR
jgi:GNAT superfamily N-acetyltransferase